jgi:hypothetical protein
LGALILTSVPTIAQRKKSAQLKDSVDLPADYSLDLQLGVAARGRAHAGSTFISGTPLDATGEEVFANLIRDPMVSGLGLPYQWHFSVVDNSVINAWSFADGEIGVDGGLARLMGTNRGLWAAALSHETEHTARRHQVRQYLYAVYVSQMVQFYQMRARAGDNSANWALLGLRIAAPIAQAKLSRDQEHDADINGMMLMARSGYHPDFVFALHHLVRISSGEQSHFAAFFSGHPRWDTRDQRDDRAYSEALAEYNRSWPNPAESPGGEPPSVVFVGKPIAVENKKNKTADLTIPIYCRNSSDLMTVAIHFLHDGRPVSLSETGESGAKTDYRQAYACSDKDDATPFSVHLPATLVGKDDRKVKAEADITNGDGAVLERVKPFDVHFPKP